MIDIQQCIIPIKKMQNISIELSKISFSIIQSFDHFSSRISNGYEKISYPNTYLNKYQFINDELTYEILKIIFNFYLALIIDFLSHQSMRLLRMTSPFTESDRLLVDLLTIYIYIYIYIYFTISRIPHICLKKS